MKFPESALAHRLLDGLEGYEIGGSAHNAFGLKTKNIDYTDNMDTVFKKAEVELCGEAMPADIVAWAEKLPLEDNSTDFIISSHVLEHVYDAIGTLKEWMRVVRPGGYVFAIVPHKERTFDKERSRTPLKELRQRHTLPNPSELGDEEHKSVWITTDVVALFLEVGLEVQWVMDVDDKVGNGFTVVGRKTS